MVDLNLEGDLNLQDLLYENAGSVVKLGITRRTVNPKVLIKTKDLMILHPRMGKILQRKVEMCTWHLQVHMQRMIRG